MPQLCLLPALTEAKVPDGGLDWPWMSHPQQATVSSVRTPHVWKPPALTEAKVPGGGLA